MSGRVGTPGRWRPCHRAQHRGGFGGDAQRGATRRPSRFDRPKEPHDWRWVVGGIGRVLISTGILMFGFVAYQLWGTALETAAAQNRLEDDFTEMVAEPADASLPGRGERHHRRRGGARACARSRPG